MTNERDGNVSKVFVLRVWVDHPDGSDRETPRRYILEDPFSKARRGFASLDDFVAYLASLSTNEPPDAP